MTRMMETNPKGLLMQRLDACLQEKAKEYMEPRDQNGRPFIENIYYLQAAAEIHIYLKTVHEFRPEEVSDLLHFADPLKVAEYCWEENTDQYAFRISELIEKHNLKEVFPAEKTQAKESLRSRLEAAKQEVRTNSPSKAAVIKDPEENPQFPRTGFHAHLSMALYNLLSPRSS